MNDLVLNDYSKEVFGNPKLLREKLEIYLQTPDKVDIYAQAAEKFFNKGFKQGLKYTTTWSWWGFFGGIWFLFYRKSYFFFAFLVVFMLIVSTLDLLGAEFKSSTLSSIGSLANFVIFVSVAMNAKFYVILDFAKILNEQNDELLRFSGGVNKSAIKFFIILMVFITLASAVAGGIAGFMATSRGY